MLDGRSLLDVPGFSAAKLATNILPEGEPCGKERVLGQRDYSAAKR